jgi:hypothetical protein
MSLIAFHKFLIATAILFSLGMAARQFSDFQITGNGWALIIALGFACAAFVLVVYLRHLRQFLKMPDPKPFLPSQIEHIDDEPAISRNGSEE